MRFGAISIYSQNLIDMFAARTQTHTGSGTGRYSSRRYSDSRYSDKLGWEQ